MKPKSSGADFEALMALAQTHQSQAYYRHRSFEEELLDELPGPSQGAAVDPDQVHYRCYTSAMQRTLDVA